MKEYELVGIGAHKVGQLDGWCATYLPEGGVAPDDFHHHIFPAHIFASYAQQFGLDVSDDDDFAEIVDIVLYDGFAGNENPVDAIEPQQAQGLLAARGDRKNAVGRRWRRRADRAKSDVTITGMGVEGVRQRLSEERYKGMSDMETRLKKLEKARASGAPAGPTPRASRQPRGNRADEGASG